MKKLLSLSFLPANKDLALLIFRVWVGFGLFYKHGIEKLTNFGGMSKHFPDIMHLGAITALTYSLLSDGICSLLVIAGFAARLAAFIIVFNLLVVFIFMHGLSIARDHASWYIFTWAVSSAFSSLGLAVTVLMVNYELHFKN
jgi:putative oxidoreductase